MIDKDWIPMHSFHLYEGMVRVTSGSCEANEVLMALNQIYRAASISIVCGNSLTYFTSYASKRDYVGDISPPGSIQFLSILPSDVSAAIIDDSL